MPPVATVEDYLELIAAVRRPPPRERLKVHIEGYPPPYDPRLSMIKVTPDPGVIEVNVQPAATWRDCVDHHRDALRGCAPEPARHRQVPDRRAACRHRRRQPCRARRGDACRQPLPAPSGPAQEPGRSTGSATLPSPTSSAACSSARRARRRASTRRARRALRAEVAMAGSAARRGRARRPGWSTTCSATF